MPHADIASRISRGIFRACIITKLDFAHRTTSIKISTLAASGLLPADEAGKLQFAFLNATRDEIFEIRIG